MFGLFKKAGKNKQLDAIIQKIEMDASNNYKDAAQAGLREFEKVLKELEAAGIVSRKQKDYYEERLSAFQERMKTCMHRRISFLPMKNIIRRSGMLVRSPKGSV